MVLVLFLECCSIDGNEKVLGMTNLKDLTFHIYIQKVLSLQFKVLSH